MATLTIRHVPDAIVERLKAAAKRKGQSMEQEVRDLLAMRYAPWWEVTRRIRQHWESLPPPSEAAARAWRNLR
jgi:plasmid stability protein